MNNLPELPVQQHPCQPRQQLLLLDHCKVVLNHYTATMPTKLCYRSILLSKICTHTLQHYEKNYSKFHLRALTSCFQDNTGWLFKNFNIALAPIFTKSTLTICVLLKIRPLYKDRNWHKHNHPKLYISENYNLLHDFERDSIKRKSLMRVIIF